MKARGNQLCKILVMIFALSILFFACVPKEKAKTPSPIRSVQTLQFAVSDKLNKEFLEQAFLLADDIAKISEGRLHVNVIFTSEDILAKGGYDLTYLYNSEIVQTSPTMETLSLPFLYNSSQHLSLALNSFDVKEIIQQHMKGIAFPLAALSSGDSVLLTPTETLHNEMGMPTFFQDLVIALDPISISHFGPTFQSLGAKLVELPKSDAEYLFPSQNHQEVTYDDVYNCIALLRTEVLSVPVSQKLFALKTRHDLIPVWFVANETIWGTLTEWEKAVILDATAGLLSRYEDGRARLQASLEKEIEKRGITIIQTERQAFAAMLYNSENATTLPSSKISFDERLYLLIQNYS